jgi:hypothetical protein
MNKTAGGGLLSHCRRQLFFVAPDLPASECSRGRGLLYNRDADRGMTEIKPRTGEGAKHGQESERGQAKDPDVLTHPCPDAATPVVFELTRVYED